MFPTTRIRRLASGSGLGKPVQPAFTTAAPPALKGKITSEDMVDAPAAVQAAMKVPN